MSELIEVAVEADRNRGNVIFMHGLDGAPITTWSTTEQGQPGFGTLDDPMFWPRWIADEFPELAVFTVGYDAAVTRFNGNAMGIVDRATNILDLLMSAPNAARLRDKPITFICHSLGGLVTKRLILDAVQRRGGEPNIARFVDQITQVIFLGTPHEGAAVANIGKLFRVYSVSSADLTKQNERLYEIGKAYRDLEPQHGVGLTHGVYYETRDTSLAPLVSLRIVEKQSADPNIGNVHPVAIDADHITICKPKAKKGEGSLVHSSVCRMLNALPAGRIPDTRIVRTSMAPAAVAEKKIVHSGLRAPVPFFTGRAVELASLDQQLWQSQRHAVALTNSGNRELALRGDAGVGKSALAHQYAHFNANRYAGAWLVRSETTETLYADLIELGEAIGVGWRSSDDTPEKKARRVSSHIADHTSGPPWLLVYDNVDRPEQLFGLTPPAGAHVLVTSRSSRMAETMDEQPIGVLKREHAVAYLMTGTRDRRALEIVEKAAGDLADALGCLPLALKHARGHHIRTGIKFET